MIKIILFLLLGVPQVPPVLVSYEEGLFQSINTNKPFIIGIGCLPPGGNWISCMVDKDLFGRDGKRITVSLNGKWVTDLPENSNSQQVEDSLKLNQVIIVRQVSFGRITSQSC